MSADGRVQIFVLNKSIVNMIHYCEKCGHLTRPTPDLLTPTELEVWQDIGNGLTLPTIAEKRCINIKTVEAHYKSLCYKLNIGTRSSGLHPMTMLTREALRIGICQL